MYNEQTTSDNIIQLFSFEVENGVNEYHLIIHATCQDAPYEEQLRSVLDAYDHTLMHSLPAGTVAVIKRYFLSDAANQSDLLQAAAIEHSDCALSIVEQPPLNGTKIALWAYLQTGVQTRSLPSGLYEVKHNCYRHLWGAGAVNQAATSEYQSRLLLNDYILQLATEQARLADHCIRTWFFVQNVDVNYAGVVKARNEVFVTQGLTPNTHFIASTGIAGRSARADELVRLDTYAVLGIRPEQIGYLHALTHLNPTHEYGVSFERGTYVDYGDRRHVFISGTASINAKGEVVYPGDIRLQTQRMWENVDALLTEADCDFSHVGHMLVYLRDMADYQVVKGMFENRFPKTPKVFLLAPVCRPGWLIEMECMAIKESYNDAYKPF